MASHKHNTMASHKRNLAADSSSQESLSFAGLLSVQDLQPKKPQTKKTVSFKHHEQEFGFSCSTPDLSCNDSSKNHPVDKSISTGQLQLQAFLYQTKQNQVAPKPAHASKKSANAHSTDGRKVADKSNWKGRSEEEKEHATSKLSFGQKLVHSFVSPCRECHARKPSVKSYSMAGEPVKLN